MKTKTKAELRDQSLAAIQPDSAIAQLAIVVHVAEYEGPENAKDVFLHVLQQSDLGTSPNKR